MGTGEFIITCLMILLISLVISSGIVLLGIFITEKIKGDKDE